MLLWYLCYFQMSIPKTNMMNVAPNPPKLLDELRQKLRYRHMSYRTEQAYVGWVRRFILFHNKRHPKEMGKPEIECYLVIPPKRAASKSRINTSPAFSAGRVSLLKPSYAFALE